MALAKSLGFMAIPEPAFPATKRQLTDATGVTSTVVVPPSKKRGDILLIKNDHRILIDVTVTRPTNITSSSNAQVNCKRLVAARAAEAGKHSLYDAECAQHGWRLVPFAVETYGALGAEAEALLSLMSLDSESSHCSMTKSQFMLHAHALISVALQSGNAEVSSVGMTNLSVTNVHDRYTQSLRLPVTRKPKPSPSQRRKNQKDRAQTTLPFTHTGDITGKSNNNTSTNNTSFPIVPPANNFSSRVDGTITHTTGTNTGTTESPTHTAISPPAHINLNHTSTLSSPSKHFIHPSRVGLVPNAAVTTATVVPESAATHTHDSGCEWGCPEMQSVSDG